MGRPADSVNLLDAKKAIAEDPDDIDGLGVTEKVTREIPHRGPRWAQPRHKREPTPTTTPQADLPGFYWSSARSGPLDGLTSPRRYEETPRWDNWMQRGLSSWGPKVTEPAVR